MGGITTSDKLVGEDLKKAISEYPLTRAEMESLIKVTKKIAGKEFAFQKGLLSDKKQTKMDDFKNAGLPLGLIEILANTSCDPDFSIPGVQSLMVEAVETIFYEET